MRTPTWFTKWPWWAWAIAVTVVVAAVAVALLVAGGDDGSTTVAADRPTTTSTSISRPARTTTTTTTSSSTTTTVASPITTSPPPTTTAPPPLTTRPPAAPRPAAAVITAYSGGGSGEVVVRWDAVPGATGYRVLRRIGNTEFAGTADFDITTGATTVADGVVNVWSEGYSYQPVRRPFPGRDRSHWFEYVDVGSRAPRTYQVVAYNASGNAPASNTATASPP